MTALEQQEVRAALRAKYATPYSQLLPPPSEPPAAAPEPAAAAPPMHSRPPTRLRVLPHADCRYAHGQTCKMADVTKIDCMRTALHIGALVVMAAFSHVFLTFVLVHPKCMEIPTEIRQRRPRHRARKTTGTVVKTIHDARALPSRSIATAS